MDRIIGSRRIKTKVLTFVAFQEPQEIGTTDGREVLPSKKIYTKRDYPRCWNWEFQEEKLFDHKIVNCEIIHDIFILIYILTTEILFVTKSGIDQKSKNYLRKVFLCQFFRNFWKCIFVGRSLRFIPKGEPRRRPKKTHFQKSRKNWYGTFRSKLLF